MVHDLRTQRVKMPVIPSANVIQQRIDELLEDARKLNVLLRVASELENTVEQSEVTSDE